MISLVRYTTKNDDGSYDYDKHLVGEAMDLLGGYEDTGLTPEEIHDFVIWLNEDREELNDLTLFNDIGELARYRETGLTPERIVELNTFEKTQCAKLLEENCKLKQEVEYWKREAWKWADKLADIGVNAADSLCDK